MPNRLKCPHCQTLLAMKSGDRIEIRYKAARYLVKAPESLMATCRKCKALVVLSE